MDIVESSSSIAYTAVNILIYLGLGIYLIYTFVIVRQVQLMTATFDLPGERIMKLFAILHTILVAGVLLLSFAVL